MHEGCGNTQLVVVKHVWGQTLVVVKQVIGGTLSVWLLSRRVVVHWVLSLTR